MRKNNATRRKKCVTHYAGCDCYEARVKELVDVAYESISYLEENQELKDRLKKALGFFIGKSDKRYGKY